MMGQTIVVELEIDATFFHFSNLNIEVNPASSLNEPMLISSIVLDCSSGCQGDSVTFAFGSHFLYGL